MPRTSRMCASRRRCGRRTIQPAQHFPNRSRRYTPVDAAKELAKLIATRRDVLLNGYTPVRVVIEAGQDPRAVPLTAEAVRTYASEICRCMKTTKDKGRIEVSLPRDIAQLYLLGLEGQWGLRPLRGISTTPLLGADGSVRNADGYDEATGLWCHGVPDVSVPLRPTKQDAERALLTLREAFCTFPFGDAAMVPDAARGVDVTILPSFRSLTKARTWLR